ncbi:hypothetical protein DL771_000405 [Monosporascus sp. 5C6A]|nr:hypothetical protein DL771_000405 [Monosporascus sp. 5C6A]
MVILAKRSIIDVVKDVGADVDADPLIDDDDPSPPPRPWRPSNFTSSAFKRRAPVAVGVLTSRWWQAGGPLSSSSSSSSSASTALSLGGGVGAALDASQGFFVARRAGEYTFSAPAGQIDDWAYLWLGEDVFAPRVFS